MTHIRILHRDETGKISDGGVDYGPNDFAGQIPGIGDIVVDPGVLEGLDRQRPENRRVWTVVGRVFNPRDTEDCVGLIVEQRAGTIADQAFL